jgi:hypothetical protein
MSLATLSQLIGLLQSTRNVSSKRRLVKKYCAGEDVYMWCKLLLPAQSGRRSHIKQHRLIVLLNFSLGTYHPHTFNVLQFKHPRPAKESTIQLCNLDIIMNRLNDTQGLYQQVEIVKPLFLQCTQEDITTLIKLFLGQLGIGGPNVVLDAIYPGGSKHFRLTHNLKGVVERNLGTERLYPISPMLASESQVAERAVLKAQTIVVEEYYGGERVQIHITPDSIKYYTKRLLETMKFKLTNFDEVVRAAFPKNASIIIDAQLLMYDPDGNLISHGKKVPDAVTHMYAFDCLYYNGFMLDYPLLVRRNTLEKITSIQPQFHLSRIHITSRPQVDEVLAAHCRHILKDAYGRYEAGRRIWYIVRTTSVVHLVVYGCWHGSGKNEHRCSRFQLGVFDKTNQTIMPLTRVFSGITTKMMEHMATHPWLPPDQDGLRLASDLTQMPVWKIGGYLNERGGQYTIALPRFVGVVENGTLESTHSMEEIKQMYNATLL